MFIEGRKTSEKNKQDYNKYTKWFIFGLLVAVSGPSKNLFTARSL